MGGGTGGWMDEGREGGREGGKKEGGRTRRSEGLREVGR